MTDLEVSIIASLNELTQLFPEKIDDGSTVDKNREEIKMVVMVLFAKLRRHSNENETVSKEFFESFAFNLPPVLREIFITGGLKELQILLD